MPQLSLAAANRILEASFAKGEALGLKPLTIAVLDAGGHLKAFGRADNTGILRPEIAIGKAWTSLGLLAPSRFVQDMAPERPQFTTNLGVMAEGKMVPAAGGVLIYDGAELLGAVGITGDLSDRDEECAIAGVEAAGLSTTAS